MITTEQQQNLFILLTGNLSKYADLKREYYKIFSPKPEFIDVFRDLKTNGYLTLRENVSITQEGETWADELLSKAYEPILKELQEGPKEYSYLVSKLDYPEPILELLVDHLVDHKQISSTNSSTLSIMPGNEPKMLEDNPNKAESAPAPTETKEIPIELYNTLDYLGLIPNSVRDHNIGESDYSKHIIQPWTIWLSYNLNPWDADIVKRVLRDKSTDPRIQDYEKIIHICQERIRQLKTKKTSK